MNVQCVGFNCLNLYSRENKGTAKKNSPTPPYAQELILGHRHPYIAVF